VLADWGITASQGRSTWFRCLARYGPRVLRGAAFARARAAWLRLEAWAVQAGFPLLLASLRPGAWLEDVEFVEFVLGLQLPPGLAALWLQHDGQVGALLSNGRNPPCFTAGLGGLFVYDHIRNTRLLGVEEALQRTLTLRDVMQQRVAAPVLRHLLVVAVSLGPVVFEFIRHRRLAKAEGATPDV
jgi:hypothetical protein